MPTIGYINWDSAYGRELLRGGKEYAEKLKKQGIDFKMRIGLRSSRNRASRIGEDLRARRRAQRHGLSQY
jgi:hypothetical protein